MSQDGSTAVYCQIARQGLPWSAFRSRPLRSASASLHTRGRSSIAPVMARHLLRWRWPPSQRMSARAIAAAGTRVATEAATAVAREAATPAVPEVVPAEVVLAEV